MPGTTPPPSYSLIWGGSLVPPVCFETASSMLLVQKSQSMREIRIKGGIVANSVITEAYNQGISVYFSFSIALT